MCMRSRRFAAVLSAPLIVIFAFVTLAASADTPDLGEPLTAAELRDITVQANGDGLPPGKGSVVQGEKLYTQHCLACHGVNGTGGINDQLQGGAKPLDEAVHQRTIGSYWPYATTVFDYVRRSMPYAQPGSLSDDEVYALTAYLLFINDIVARETTLDAAQLRAIKMPNRARFFSTYQLPD